MTAEVGGNEKLNNDGIKSKTGEEWENISQMARLSVYWCEVFVVYYVSCRL